MNSVARVRTCLPSLTRHRRRNNVGLVIGAVGVPWITCTPSLTAFEPCCDMSDSSLDHPW